MSGPAWTDGQSAILHRYAVGNQGRGLLGSMLPIAIWASRYTPAHSLLFGLRLLRPGPDFASGESSSSGSESEVGDASLTAWAFFDFLGLVPGFFCENDRVGYGPISKCITRVEEKPRWEEKERTCALDPVFRLILVVVVFLGGIVAFFDRSTIYML